MYGHISYIIIYVYKYLCAFMYVYAYLYIFMHEKFIDMLKYKFCENNFKMFF